MNERHGICVKKENRNSKTESHQAAINTKEYFAIENRTNTKQSNEKEKKKEERKINRNPRKIEKETNESSNLIVSDFIFLPLGVHVSEIKRNTK